MPCPLAEAIEAQRIWTSKAQYADAEQKFHAKMDDIAALAGKDVTPYVLDRIVALEKENATLHSLVSELKKLQLQSENRIKSLEDRLAGVNLGAKPAAPAAAAKAPAKGNDDDDDDVDLFGSDSEEEDETAAKIREQRLAEYAAKKSKKPALIAKSNSF